MVADQHHRAVWGQWLIRATAAILIVALLAAGIGMDNRYRSVAVRALASTVDHSLRPGDHVVVDAFLRYTWALYEDPHPDITFASDWMPGFSVVSTQPDVFIVPSYPNEGGSEPAT